MTMKTTILATFAAAALATACAHQDASPDASSTPPQGVTNAMPGTPAAGDTNDLTDKSGTNGTGGTGGTRDPRMTTGAADMPPAPPDDTTPGNAPGSMYPPRSTMTGARPPTLSDAPPAKPGAPRTAGDQPIVAETQPLAPSKTGVTATSQSNGADDVKLVGAIRRAMMADPQLSFAAKNVTVVTNGGNVYLRGTVHTAKERDRVETLASSQAGVGTIDNQIAVKP